MTLFRVNFDVIQRSRGGNAVRAAAYARCCRLTDADRKKHFDFRRKADEHVAHAMLLPDGAPQWAGTPGRLWRAAERAEKRGDAQPARTVVLTLPREAPKETWLDLARTVAEPWRRAGMVVQTDVHSVTAEDGQPQPHVHYTLTMRRLGPEGFSKTKERSWNQVFRDADGRVERERIARIMTTFLREHGIECDLDHRSHADRGIAAAPEANVSKDDWQAHKEGRTTEPVAHVLMNRSLRQQLASAEAAEAAATAAREALERIRKERITAARRRDTAVRALHAESNRVRRLLAAEPPVISPAAALKTELGHVQKRVTRLQQMARDAASAAQQQRRAVGWWRRLVDPAAAAKQRQLDAVAVRATAKAGLATRFKERDLVAARGRATKVARESAAAIRTFSSRPDVRDAREIEPQIAALAATLRVRDPAAEEALASGRWADAVDRVAEMTREREAAEHEDRVRAADRRDREMKARRQAAEAAVARSAAAARARAAEEARAEAAAPSLANAPGFRPRF